MANLTLSNLFSNTQFTNLNLVNWHTNEAKSMNNMFRYANQLREVKG